MLAEAVRMGAFVVSESRHRAWVDPWQEDAQLPLVSQPPSVPWPWEPQRRTPFDFWRPDCRHWRQRFALEGGLHVFASAWVDRPAEKRPHSAEDLSGQPDVGFYLDGGWAAGALLTSPGFTPPFVTRKGQGSRLIVYPWRDYAVPENLRLFRRALKWILLEAGRGTTIEIGCMGGHGRTGTTLACLLVLQGIQPARGIRRVRTRYCKAAIESARQEEFVRRFH